MTTPRTITSLQSQGVIDWLYQQSQQEQQDWLWLAQHFYHCWALTRNNPKELRWQVPTIQKDKAYSYPNNYV